VKFKYYLRGCGLGIILTVLVMAVSIQTRGGIITDEKAIVRAKELGMIMPEESLEGESDSDSADPDNTDENGETVGDTEDTGEAVGTEAEESTEADGDSASAASEEDDTADAGTGTVDEAKDKDDASDAQVTSVVKKVMASSDSVSEKVSDSEEKEKDKDNDNEEETETVIVKVERGDACRQVAQKLKKSGLVSDSEKFRQYMQRKGYDDRICIGSFQFKQGMTYEEIAKILVGKA
jgi:hypothetical protein